MNAALSHHPSPTEMRAHLRHRSFHHKIAATAAALNAPAAVKACESPAPPDPAPMTPSEWFAEAWFFIESVSPCQTLTMKQIKQAVCDHFGLQMVSMTTGRRNRLEVRPRQIAMFLCKQLTAASLPVIGRAFGGKDHTTVLHANRRVALECEKDPAFKEAVDKIRADLEASL